MSLFFIPSMFDSIAWPNPFACAEINVNYYKKIAYISAVAGHSRTPQENLICCPWTPFKSAHSHLRTSRRSPRCQFYTARDQTYHLIKARKMWTASCLVIKLAVQYLLSDQTQSIIQICSNLFCACHLNKSFVNDDCVFQNRNRNNLGISSRNRRCSW